MQKNPKKFMSNFHMRVSTKSPGFQRVCCSRNTKNVKDWNQLLRTVAVVKLCYLLTKSETKKKELLILQHNHLGEPCSWSHFSLLNLV